MVTLSVGGTEFSGAALSFTYDPAALGSALQPTAGPATGGSVVTLQGAGFSQQQQLKCRFGEQVVPASFLSATEVSCVAPPLQGSWASVEAVQTAAQGAPLSTKVWSVQLDVSTNGADFSTIGLRLYNLPFVLLFELSPACGPVEGSVFMYQHLPEVASVSPTAAAKGALPSVLVGGAHFAFSAALRCRFGQEVVFGLFVNWTHVRCVPPVTVLPVNLGSSVTPTVAVTLTVTDVAVVPASIMIDYTQLQRRTGNLLCATVIFSTHMFLLFFCRRHFPHSGFDGR
jgi:hypothetical protein